MGMSRSEAGKLGAIKMIETMQFRVQDRIDTYNKNPILCLECNTAIEYEKRRNKFCCHSHAASFNNKATGHIIVHCPNCNKEMDCLIHNPKKFCSHKCQQDFRSNQKIEEWKSGSKIDTRTLKKYLLEKYGHQCFECSIREWNNKKITLELEHKDGNSENNSEENVCLLCPNCHSQTSTYKVKNKGNGRHSRRQRYKDGKSY